MVAVPTVTALREDRRGRVAVELDGQPWRTVPVDVAVRAGLAEGRALDRAALRLVRRELRRAEALAISTGALRRRDMSRRRLGERLERAGIAPAAAAESLEALSRAGLVDDTRAARALAASLADRGYGDAAIRHDLERHGLADHVDAALADLPPELARAARIVEQRGVGARTARYLAGKGFGADALEAAAGAHFANGP